MNYITDKELREILKVSRQTLLAWRNKGMPHKKFGKCVRYDLHEVLKWLNDSK